MICPICIVNPAGDPNQMVRDLAQHMTVEHQASGLKRSNHFLCGGEGKSNGPISAQKTVPLALTLSHSHSKKGESVAKKKKKLRVKKKYFVRRKKRKKSVWI